jgi:hypothetical protein
MEFLLVENHKKENFTVETFANEKILPTITPSQFNNNKSRFVCNNAHIFRNFYEVFNSVFE